MSKCLFKSIIEGPHRCQNQFKWELDVQRFICPYNKINLVHYKGLTDADRSGTQQYRS